MPIDTVSPAHARGACAPWRRWAIVASLGLIPLGAVAMPKAGDLAPDFVGRTDDGRAVSLAAYQGKVVVLSFWASWCGPCRKELPILEGIQQTAKDRVQVIAVNIESKAVFHRLVGKMGSLQMLVAGDSAQEAQGRYGVQGIPHMVIVGKDGRIIRVNRGYDDDGVDQVVDDLNRALAQ